MKSTTRVILTSHMVGVACVCWTPSIESAASNEEPANARDLEIVEMIEACDHEVAFANERIGHDCLKTLNALFLTRPIWETDGPLLYYDGLKSKASSHAINRRSAYLQFNRADYLLDDLPTWSDIFDGRVDHRRDIVLQVFRDDICRELAHRGEIRPALAERCQAKELFKYATHLDACLTGLKRYTLLANPRGTDGRSVYQSSVDEITRQDSADQEARLAALAELHMHALWMKQICDSLPAVAFDDELQPMQFGNLGTSDFSIAEFSKIMAKGHDAALGIAARSGDEWAIQSYYPPHPKRDPEYWKAMQRINPLLFHRWMATFVGGTFLTDEERMWHAVRAYAIEREASPGLRPSGLSGRCNGRPCRTG